MFNELSKMFGGKQKERRHSPRKKGRFNVSWVKNGNELVAGLGMEISLNGMLFATQNPPDSPDFDIIMELGSRKIRTRLHTARKGSIVRDNMQWSVLGCTFSGIAADDYDALVRYCKDMHEVGNKAAEQLASMDKTDDAYRMLPMRVQQHVLDALIRLGPPRHAAAQPAAVAAHVAPRHGQRQTTSSGAQPHHRRPRRRPAVVRLGTS